MFMSPGTLEMLAEELRRQAERQEAALRLVSRKLERIESAKILDYEGLWGAGEEYAYETLNFADGRRNAQQIRDAVSAEYGPVPLNRVVEYLRTLEQIGVVEQVK